MSLSSVTATRTALGVRLHQVGRTFPAPRQGGEPRTVLADIDLEIAPGEIIALIGASGCGKSTLLRQIGGLDTPSTGTVVIDETPVTGIDRRCAIAFQEARLLPWRSIHRNIALGLTPGIDRETGEQRVRGLLDLVGLTDCAEHRPRQISGGMAQRASLARALARNPGVLLLDEPFGALDALTRLNMHDLLLDVHRREPTTIVLVTHDVDEALALADRVVLLGRDDTAGTAATVRRIEQVPDTYDHGDPRLGELRRSLLQSLGVNTH